MNDYLEVEGVPLDLRAPPESKIAPPVETKAQLAPLHELSWEDFERLCVAVVAAEEGELERVRRYAIPGQKEKGIDVYARQAGGGYSVYQCKRTQDLEPGEIEAAVNEFIKGDWAEHSVEFTICASASGIRTERAEAIERETTRLKKLGIEFDVWDAEEISRRPKALPVVVLDFFGKAWVDRFCTEPLPRGAVERLDLDEVQTLRRRLRCFYAELFKRHEINLEIGSAIPLAVLRQRKLSNSAPSPDSKQGESGPEGHPAEVAEAREDGLFEERLSLPSWLARGRQSLLLGSAGGGKSTALRQICLDLLSGRPTMNELGGWADFIPVWIPFGAWVTRAGRDDRDASMEAAVLAFFESYGEEELGRLARQSLRDERLVLLVDGLDEWTDSNSAQLACDRLEQAAAMRNIPVLAAGRREALKALGTLSPAWEQAELAPLTESDAAALLEAHGATAYEAQGHVADLQRSAGVEPLARIPLLLVLTWQSRRKGKPLPTSRVDALEAVVQYLVDEYPKRRERVAGARQEPLTSTTEDERIAIEELALAVQDNGPMPLAINRARLALRNALKERGLTEAESSRDGRAILERGRGAMGLILTVEPGITFAHRSLQEHLASRALLRRDDEVQRRIVGERASAANWHAVILGLLGMIGDGNRLDGLVEQIESAPSLQERWSRSGLLAETAVGTQALGEKTRERLLRMAQIEVERGLHDGVRRDVVDAICEGIGRRELQPIAHRIQHWLPRHFDWGAIHELVEWATEDEKVRSHIADVLFQTLASDDARAARVAAGGLRALSPPELEARLMARLQEPIGASERAASLDALARTLPSDPSVSRWMERARHSDETMLRVVALGWRVHSGLHEREDQEALLTLLDGWTHIEHPWSDAPAEIVQTGWPDDQEIRDQALETVGAGPTRPIEITAASWLLLSGYHGDSRVRDWILRELDSEHPFVTVDDVAAYELLGRRIGVEPEVGEAIDRRISRLGSPFMPAVYAASLATNSETGRKRLLKLLESEDSGALGWVVRALREGWSEDAEVQEALQELAQRSQAGWVTDQLTDVVLPAELDDWLLERLRDEENGRPSRALQALAERGPEVREKALDEGLKRLGGLNRRADEQVLETLISRYSDLPRGEKLALSHLDDGSVPLSVLVRAARSQPSLHKPVFDRLIPLPQALRRRLAERLGRGAGTSDGARQTVAGWRADVSSSVASAAASADARRSSEQEKRGLIDTAIESLHSLRLPPQHDSYPGLAALIECRAIDRFAGERARWGDRDLLKLDLHAHYEPDWSLASLLAAHWGEIEAILGDPSERLTRVDSHGLWELVAPFAAAHPQARQACLQYVREHGTGGRPNLIAFLADARPRSKELLSALGGIGETRHASSQAGLQGR